MSWFFKKNEDKSWSTGFKKTPFKKTTSFNGLMLPLKYRLQKNRDIQLVLKKGRFFDTAFLSLKVLANRFSPGRFCFVVSNKISKKPTIRNLIKRRLRYIIRQYLAVIKPGYDIVVLTKPGIQEKKYQEIKQLMAVLLERASLI